MADEAAIGFTGKVVMARTTKIGTLLRKHLDPSIFSKSGTKYGSAIQPTTVQIEQLYIRK